MKRLFGAALVALSFALLSFGAPALPAGKMDLDFHKKVPPSELKIELSPAATVTRTQKGVVLPLKITNASADDIKTTMAHEWHGGEWPLTALYATATPDKGKKPKAFTPVYLAGEDQDAVRSITLPAGKTIDLEVRMDWPGTGSVIAVSLMQAPGKYTVQFVLVFEVAGKQQYVITTDKVVDFLAK